MRDVATLRVMFWTELFWPHIGGAEVWSACLMDALRKRGHELIVVTRQDSPGWPAEAVHRGIAVHRFPFWRALAGGESNLLLRLHRAITALKRAFEPELVHLHSSGPSLFFHEQTKGVGDAPVLASVHGPLKQTGHGTLPRKVLGSADWVVANSLAMLCEVRSVAPEITNRSSCIYYGLSDDRPVAGPPPLRPRRLLCLGRLVNEKGFDLMLDVLPVILRRFPDLRLIVAGDGPARAQLERLAVKLGIAGAVRFVGAVPPRRVPALMCQATLVVMPSRWLEAFGLVALEAGWMGRPVVAARVGGIPEIVVHGQTGLLFEKEDRRGLSEAIEFLLNHPERIVAMGGAARSRVEERFTLARSVDAYEALYRRLTQRNGGS